MSVLLPRALLLDLDETIITSREDADEVWRAVCGESATQAGLSPQEVYEAVITSRDWFWADEERSRVGRADLRAASREIVERALARFGVGQSDLAREMADSYRDRRDQFILLPGSLDALQTLRERQVALALLTNGAGPFQRAKIDQFDLARYFDFILIEGEAGFGKPNERVYLRALETLGTPPSEAWMVGDDLNWDVGAPQRLDIYSVWVDRRGNGLPEESHVRPDRIIRSLAELV